MPAAGSGSSFDAVARTAPPGRTGLHGESADHVDLIWDPCFEEGLSPTWTPARTASVRCARAPNSTRPHARPIAGFRLNLGKVIDPRSPHETWFRRKLELLCMLTSDGQIVLGDLTTVEPATDEYPGLQATFEVTLWANV